MAVVPLRGLRPEIDTDPTPDMSKPVKLTVGEDGAVEIEIGSSKPPKPQRPKADRKNFDANLAEELDDTALATLASFLIEGIEADDEERAEWQETVDRTADYLGIKLTNPTASVSSDGTVCQAVATCLLESAVKLWGTAYAELLPAGGPVKVERVDTPAPAQQPPVPPAGGGAGLPDSEPGQAPDNVSDAAGDDLADALEKDMNWYLTKGDRGYYPDFSKMLMSRNLIGVAFREVYRCPVKRMPISRWIMAQDLIVQGDPAHLEDGGRVTARKKVRQSTMRRMMISGEYVDVPLVSPLGEASKTEIVIGETQGTTPTSSLPRDHEHTIYECCCELGSGTYYELEGSLGELDLDEKGKNPGYPLPYRVTIDKDSRIVLSIRRNWKKGDPDHRVRRRFVKYGFIPAFGFYDWGLIHLAGNPTQAATMLQRSGVDTTLFANFPAWAMAQGPATRMEDTVFRPGVGQAIKVPVSNGAKIGDVLMPFPYKEPSAQTMALLAKLEGDVKSLAGVVDIPVGEGRIGNTPVGTIMSYIESVSMVPGAVHKADHIAQSEEFDLLRELIAEDPSVLTRGNRSPARQWQASEEVMSPDLAPMADPNTPSQIHRLLKIQGLIMMGGLPQFAQDGQGPIANNRAIFKRAAEVLVGGNTAEFAYPPQPPPQGAPPTDPKIVAAQIKAETEQQQGQQKMQQAQQAHDGKMQELVITSQDKAADREATNQREAMKLGAVRTKVGADMVTAAVGHGHDAAMQGADMQHQSGMQAKDHAQQTEQALAAPLLAPPDQGSSE